jgi:hypothetical protein
VFGVVGKEPQIGWVVVAGVSVDVVNNLFWRQISAKLLLHHKPVDGNIPAVLGCSGVVWPAMVVIPPHDLGSAFPAVSLFSLRRFDVVQPGEVIAPKDLLDGFRRFPKAVGDLMREKSLSGKLSGLADNIGLAASGKVQLKACKCSGTCFSVACAVGHLRLPSK